MKTDFYESAKASNGFRDHVATGMKVISKAVGFVANTVRGLELAFKGVQIVAAHAMNGWVDIIASIASVIPRIDESTPLIGKHGKAINSFLDGAAFAAEASKNRVKALNGELHSLAMKDLPSDNVEKYFKKIQSEAQIAAEKVAEASSKLKQGGGDNNPEVSGTDVEKVASELNAQNETTLEAYRRRQEIIDTALSSKQLSEERHLELSGNAWRKHQTELSDIDAKRAKARLQTGKQLFGDLATLSQHGNKRLQSIGKAAAKVNILIGTFEAAQSAYKHAASWGGNVAGALAAAAATTAGWMRYRAVDSAGSGSSSGGLSGSTTFDQKLPDAAVSIDNIPGAAERRSIPTPHIENYYAEGSVSAIDTQSFSTAMMNNRESVASATEAHLNEYGRSLAS
jgi:hypothetical protein